MEKKIEEVINRLDALKKEVAELEKMVAQLTAAPAAEPEEAVDLSEPIDLTLDEMEFVPEPEADPVAVEDIPENSVEEVPEPVEEAVDIEDIPEVPVEEPVAVEPEPAAPVAEPVAEPVAPEASEEGLFGLFGEEIRPEPKENRRGRRRRESIAESAEGESGKAVVDAMAVQAAWRTDIPGPEVKSLRSAIALGDQVLFINRLFRKDSALYQDTVDRLNSTSTLAEALGYLSETFPEWDLASDDVYKFMMAVRRKIRR
ncbi:MAG: hypothetical protein IJ255_02765 [Bacteroidales bacterium]|nr:hypothetical protein [Bacteroidales bacterium]